MIKKLYFCCLLLAPLFAAPNATPLLILKAPRSGSSWFTSMLNKLDGVYLTEEIFSSLTEHNPAAALAYLVKSFHDPMKVYPLGREMAYRTKRWHILGATYNPLMAWWVNLRELPAKVPNLRLIVYLRTNKVKHAIATIRSRLLKSKCSTAIITTTGSCKIPSKTYVNLKRFDESLISKLAIDKYILDTASILAEKLEDDHVYYIRYEDLMKDSGFQINKLFWGLGLNEEKLDHLSSASSGRCKDNCTKNTLDDLRMVVSNYQEVEAWIEQKYPCLLSQLHETIPNVVQSVVEKSCGDLFTSRVGAILERYQNGTTSLLM